MLVVGCHEGQFLFATDGRPACERETLLAHGNAVARCPTVLLHGIEKPIGYIHDDRAGAFASVILHTLALETRIRERSLWEGK